MRTAEGRIVRLLLAACALHVAAPVAAQNVNASPVVNGSLGTTLTGGGHAESVGFGIADERVAVMINAERIHVPIRGGRTNGTATFGSIEVRLGRNRSGGFSPYGLVAAGGGGWSSNSRSNSRSSLSPSHSPAGFSFRTSLGCPISVSPHSRHPQRLSHHPQRLRRVSHNRRAASRSRFPQACSFLRGFNPFRSRVSSRRNNNNRRRRRPTITRQEFGIPFRSTRA